MGTASTTPAAFTGTSAYSADFANVIARAVAIAQLPITQLTANQTALTNQSTELTKIDTKFTALQTAVAAVDTALGGSSYQTDVSSPNVVNVSVGDGAQEGYYTMNVSSIGAYESSMSTANWNVPEVAKKPSTFTLVVGSQTFSVTGADNSAQSVVDAINSQHGDLVQATTVNVSPTDTRIIAYVVPDGASVPTAGDLRTFLLQKLPDYMVPSAFVRLERLWVPCCAMRL